MIKSLGAHLSTRDGLRYPLLSARGLGLEVIQIMLGEPTSWTPYKITQEGRNEFLKLSYGIGVYVHLPYTINPCLGISERFYKTQRAIFSRYLETAMEVGARAVVIHPGYKKELSEEMARGNLLRFMGEVKIPEGLMVLIETDSGSKNGSAVGSLDFIEDVLTVLGGEGFGMVLDTEHLFARGIDLWEDSVRKETLDRYRKWIRLIHLNAPDPGVELGSYVDRHSISFEAYPRDSTAMIQDLLKEFPCILERASLVVIEKDVRYVTQLTAEKGGV